MLMMMMQTENRGWGRERGKAAREGAREGREWEGRMGV